MYDFLMVMMPFPSYLPSQLSASSPLSFLCVSSVFFVAQHLIDILSTAAHPHFLFIAFISECHLPVHVMFNAQNVILFLNVKHE